MTVHVRYWAGAQRAAGIDTEEVDAAAATTVAALRALLADRRELTKVATVASFLVDEVPAGDTTTIPDGAVVDVLPPFAGG